MESRSRKDELRRHIRALRNAEPNKDESSHRICQQVTSLPEYNAAATVMLYVDARSEVRTGPLLDHALASGKTVVIPYCDGDELIAWRLTSREELSPGAFGILEPRAELRWQPDRLVDPQMIDLICVPGVAFDRSGNRLGSGRGYYDRLLPQLRADALKLGLAFSCQLVDAVPVDAHDVAMDGVILENGRT